MDSRLDGIENWKALAIAARYSVGALADTCNVSRRHLGRYFRATFGLAPLAWMKVLRSDEAQILLRAGEQAKVVAGKVGYTHVSSFSRAFKRAHRVGPRVFQQRPN